MNYDRLLNLRTLRYMHWVALDYRHRYQSMLRKPYCRDKLFQTSVRILKQNTSSGGDSLYRYMFGSPQCFMLANKSTPMHILNKFW